ncbi:MAG: hypothetical protein A2Y10_17670 [Planctomycetes bacterium GWF2_41_51]|nr:MAG: hypothetical protein A2Y10_17670 [Planctomycetes bacterium GWF2_41_51]
MIKTGLVSVTFRQFSANKIINLCSQAGLEAIEWGGDIHVPHGDIKQAQAVGNMTRNAGLNVSSYGSYYKVGESKKLRLPFQCVLETAKALNTPMIRVWAGALNSEEADNAYWNMILEDAFDISSQAKKEDIEIAFEFHNNTLVNTPDSAKKLLTQIGKENFGIYWQPILGLDTKTNLQGLDIIIPWLRNIHVFHWRPDYTRLLLAEGIENWKLFFDKIKTDNKDRFAMLEFVKDDNVENFLKDAQILNMLCAL